MYYQIISHFLLEFAPPKTNSCNLNHTQLKRIVIFLQAPNLLGLHSFVVSILCIVFFFTTRKLGKDTSHNEHIELSWLNLPFIRIHPEKKHVEVIFLLVLLKVH